MGPKKGRPTPREVRSQKAQMPTHHPGSEKGVKWPMAVKDGSSPHRGTVSDTGLKGKADDLTYKLQRALDSDPNLSAYGLKVQSSGEALQVTGIVDTLQEKYALRDLMSDLGISEFQDAVSLSTDGSVDQNDIIAEVREELDADHELDSANINLRSTDGHLILTGTVSSPEHKRRAENAARRASGVTGIQNNLSTRKQDLSPEALFHSQVNNEGPHPRP